MSYQKETANRSSPFYRSDMVERVLVDISTEYVVTWANSQNPDVVCLSGLTSCEDAQWPAILQNLRNLPLCIFRVLFLSNCQSVSSLIGRVLCQFMPVRYSPIWIFSLKIFLPLFYFERVWQISLSGKPSQIIYISVDPYFGSVFCRNEWHWLNDCIVTALYYFHLKWFCLLSLLLSIRSIRYHPPFLSINSQILGEVWDY